MSETALTKKELKELRKVHDHRIWLEKYNQFVVFRRKHKRLPKQYEITEDGFRIGIWQSYQRKRYREGKMPLWRAVLLSELGVNWGKKNESWDIMYEKVKKFIRKNNRLPTPNREHEEAPLGNWRYNQNVLIKKGKLSKKRTQKIKELGTIEQWNDDRWYERLNEGIAFVAKHQRIPQRTPECDYERKLAKWREAQLTKLKKGMLSRKKANAFKTSGLVMEKKDSWGERYKELTQFIRENGQFPVVTAKSQTERSLALWGRREREKVNSGILEKRKEKALRATGIFETKKRNYDIRWKRVYDEYADFIKNNGRLPKEKTEHYLAKWGYAQRDKQKKGKLAKWQEKLLRPAGILDSKKEKN